MKTKAHSFEPRTAQCPMSLGEVDLFAPGAQAHWFDSYRIMHKEAPVFRVEGGGDVPGSDAFILTKFEDIQSVVKDPERFPTVSDEANGLSAVEAEVIGSKGFGEAVNARRSLRPDIETHKLHRKVLTDPWVGPPGASRHEKMIVDVANSLVDGWIENHEVELVSQFAAPLPQTVITKIIGFPLEDMPVLRRWDEAQVRRFVYGKTHRSLLSEEEERENAKALAEFHEYTQHHIDIKRTSPVDDMISYLISVRYGPEMRALSDGEIISVIYGMHIGGNETTQYALTAQAMLLAEDPDLFEMLRSDRSKVPLFVEEAMRLYSPTQGLSSRRAAEDVEIRGVRIPQGSLLHLRYGAGNRDEEKYPNPEEIDLDRRAITAHLTFSQGVRSCPGAALSRAEQIAGVNVMLDRLKNLRPAPGKNTFELQPGIMLGLYALHLEFD